MGECTDAKFREFCKILVRYLIEADWHSNPGVSGANS
jgi:hypothetical protein